MLKRRFTAVPVAAVEPSKTAESGRGRSEKMDAFVRAVGSSPRFSFEAASAAVSAAIGRHRAQS